MDLSLSSKEKPKKKKKKKDFGGSPPPKKHYLQKKRYLVEQKMNFCFVFVVFVGIVFVVGGVAIAIGKTSSSFLLHLVKLEYVQDNYIQY